MPISFCVGDCETGGVDDRLNPLLSVALLLADHNFDEVDGFASKILPPPNTWLEVPIPQQQIKDFGFSGRRIEYWLEVHTKVKSTTSPKDGWLINAGAVEKNNFVEIGPNGWILESMDQWMQDSVSLDLAQEIFVRWMVKHCESPPIGIAHQASFDTKFIGRFMPTLLTYFATVDPAIRKSNSDFSSGWYCTCTALKKYNKFSPTPGENAQLKTLAKLAGFVPRAEHEALADTRSCLAGLRWLKTGKTFSTNSGL